MNDVYEYMNEIFKNLKYFNEIPKGKGVRAKLITTINPDAIILASAVESIHLASLLHDDVIDNSKLRRGKESINAKYGDRIAIMLGDMLFAKALEILTNYNKKSASKLAKTIYTLTLGEMEDVELSENINLNEKKYLEMIYKKTAVLIEIGCEESARLAKLDTQKYAVYGRNLGLVFQIIDDILDILSDEKTLGKPVMNDLYEGKMTLPFIYLYKDLNKKEKEYFKTLFKKRLNKEEEKWIKTRISNAIQKSYEEAKKLANEGIKEIKEPYLRELMLKLIDRKF